MPGASALRALALGPVARKMTHGQELLCRNFNPIAASQRKSDQRSQRTTWQGFFMIQISARNLTCPFAA